MFRFEYNIKLKWKYRRTIQWQSSPDNTYILTNISGATATPYTTTGGITATTYYRAIVTGGSCNGTSNTVTVLTYPIGVTAIATPNPVCFDSNATLRLSGYTSGTIQWQSSVDSLFPFYTSLGNKNTIYNNRRNKSNNIFSCHSNRQEHVMVHQT